MNGSISAVGNYGDSRVLSAMTGVGRKIDAGDPRQTRQAAVQLVSQVFFAPMLQEMRELPFGKEIGHGGRMEDAFGQQFDQRVADSVAREGVRPLVDKIEQKLKRKQFDHGVRGPQTDWDRAIIALRQTATTDGAGVTEGSK
ncbi:MAG: hypothetical protein ACKVS9_19700 [Phycisphaerae bacterium]